MPSGSKPLAEPLLTQFYVAIIMASLGHTELNVSEKQMDDFLEESEVQYSCISVWDGGSSVEYSVILCWSVLLVKLLWW